MDKLKTLITRLNKLNIKIELFCNYPWVYLDTINSKRVKEKFQSEHGFCIAWMPIRPEQQIKFTDISVIFNLIRKYL